MLLYILLLSPFLYFFRHFYTYVGTEPSHYYRTALTICLSKNYRPFSDIQVSGLTADCLVISQLFI